MSPSDTTHGKPDVHKRTNSRDHDLTARGRTDPVVNFGTIRPVQRYVQALHPPASAHGVLFDMVLDVLSTLPAVAL